MLSWDYMKEQSGVLGSSFISATFVSKSVCSSKIWADWDNSDFLTGLCWSTEFHVSHSLLCASIPWVFLLGPCTSHSHFCYRTFVWVIICIWNALSSTTHLQTPCLINSYSSLWWSQGLVPQENFAQSSFWVIFLLFVHL